ncbi:MAG: bactofilin family protein [Alphaproteobacteria bacterium]
MFHRVKSDVQNSEQKQQAESDKGYGDADTRSSSVRQEQYKPSASEEKSERSQGATYGKKQPKTQEDTHNMRAREEAVTQKKYGREAEEERSEEAAPRASYQPSVARSSGYNNSYTGSSSSSYTAPQAPDTYTGNDRTLTIGRGINMSGEIDACDHLMVEGTVEAALKGAKLLEIAESGTFYGTVEIEEATIAGRFEGDITVNGRLTIKSSGVITGSIAYRELEVESGAVLDGRMTPLKGVVDPKSVDRYRAGSDASAMAKAKEIVSKKDNREPANTENGLFSKAHTSY